MKDPIDDSTGDLFEAASDTQAPQPQTTADAWASYAPAPSDHAALARYSILPSVARVVPDGGLMPFEDDGQQWAVIPLHNAHGTLTSLAFLSPQHGQPPRFATNAAKGGHVIGTPDKAQPLYLSNDPQTAFLIGRAGLACVWTVTPDTWSATERPAAKHGGNLVHVAKDWIKAGYQVAIPTPCDQADTMREWMHGIAATVLPTIGPLSFFDDDEVAAMLGELWRAHGPVMSAHPQTEDEQNARACEGQTTDGEPIDIEGELNRLASLSAVEYEQQRTDAAKALNMRASALDKIIKGIKADAEQQDNSGELFPIVEPWGESVDGVALLDDITGLIHSHIACENPTAQAAALWIVFTWCIDAMQIAPIACITAPEKRCGKTQLLTLIGLLCHKPLPASNITAAALFRSIDKWSPTLLIDEADSFMKDNEELRGVVNAGHSRSNAFVIRTTGDNHEPSRFNVWGAKAISGIGHLSETLKDRSILLELRRKQSHEQRERLRHANPAKMERIKRQLCRWSTDNLNALRHARPALPDMLNDRAQDNWESLLAIADQVGDHWPTSARKAALSISGIETNAPSVNEELLADIKAVFDKTKQSKIFSTDLLEYLCADDEAPWATYNRGRPLTARQLSGRLSGFGLKSKQVWAHGRNNRGYDVSDFNDIFARYLPEPSVSSARPLEPLQDKAFKGKTSARSGSGLADKKPLQPLQGKASSTLADRNASASNDAQNTLALADQATPLQPLQWSMDV